MNVTTNINKKDNLRIHKVTGRIVFDKLMEALNEIYSKPDHNPEMNTLWDLRDADVSSFPSVQVQHIQSFVSKYWGKSGKSRSALIVSEDVAYGLSRMYEIMSEGKTAGKIMVFRDYEEALKWVNSIE